MSFRKSVMLAIVFLLLVGFAIPLLIGGLEVFAILSSLPVWVIPLILVVMFVIWNLNVLRLIILLDGQANNLGYWRIMRIYMATEFVSKTTPMGVGGPAAAVSFLAPHGVKAVPSLVVFGVSAFMDAVVLFSLIGFFAVGGLTVNLEANLLVGISLVCGLMLIAIGFIALLRYRHKLFFCLLISIPGFSLVGDRVKAKTRKLVVSLHRALKKLSALPLSRIWLSWSACFLYWSLYLSTLYICICLLGGGVSWPESGFIQAIAMGIGHILMVPGGAGGAELSATLLLEPKLGATTAAAAILLWRFSILYLYLLVGGVSLVSLGVGTPYGNEKRTNL